MRGTRWTRAAAARPPGRTLALAAALGGVLAAGEARAQCTTANTVTADVVALDVVIFYNRLGAHDPHAMMFALKQDVVPNTGTTLSAGNARLRNGKRPRPLVLRVQQGGCLTINFTNYLSPTPRNNQPGTRAASVHVTGMQLVTSILDDGSNVGVNTTSLVEPGASRTYRLYAQKEGTFLLYSTAQTTGGDGDGGQISRGLFGAVNVEPPQSEWYRSQLTAADLVLAQRKNASGVPLTTPAGHPVLNYDATYPTGHPLAGRTILKMVQNGKLVHSDLTAIITGPNKGRIPAGTYDTVVVERDRHRPFREFTIIFHDEIGIIQAFDSIFEDPKFEHTLHSGRDAFAINYGTGGIGAEVLANRFGVGPMWDCNECKYEEFFLSSWAVGDPAMIVDVPADADANGDGIPDPGRKATKAFFPDDPSNVYHAYMNDHLKFRNLHAGPKEHHIFHLHAHQWLHSPNSDNSTYLDSQAIGPGSGYTYEVTFDGGSNRNKTPGDAIFHCHFYPHFAQGMWALWRVHDVFEKGTVMDPDGTPATGARALPDGEIVQGTPIPAVVPIPTYALAPLPTAATPGYPFFVPGIAGHRPPKPPLDTKFDGGLRRHVVRDGVAQFPALNRLDFHKDNVTIVADTLPEAGTVLERNAMTFHARRSQPTFRFDPVTGTVVADTFITNGRPAVAGAPYADPCVDDFGRAQGSARIYKSANLQLDAKYNKALWHFPQHRMSALWQDVDSFRLGIRPPEPLFFRANTNDCITFHLVNLIPKEYLL
ncbi:MAG TPA: multicopper oxidase domain-containing protein, partial [Longimicrobiaceae bacterium]|nr:multicopper oxidase domain-containing protein [Longimicrobiaceae bacterium]